MPSLPQGTESVSAILSDGRFVPGGLGCLGLNVDMCVLRDSFHWLHVVSFPTVPGRDGQWWRVVRLGKTHENPGERGASLWGSGRLGLGRHG